MAIRPGKRHQEFPSLDPNDLERIRNVARDWARLHPQPSVPVLVLLDGSELTPEELVKALDRPETGLGRTLVRMFAVAMTEPGVDLGMEQILEPFRHDVAGWSRSQRSIELE